MQNNIVVNLEELNIKWETERNAKKEQTLLCFIYNLLEANDIETIKGIDFIVRDKEVYIKTNYHYFQKNGLAKLVLIGGEYTDNKIGFCERTAKQPVYSVVGYASTRKMLIGYLKLRVNYLRLLFI